MAVGEINLADLVQTAITNLLKEEFSDQILAQTQTCPEMISIRETAARSGLSEQFVRYELIPKGKVSYIMTGSKTLVNWQSVINYLNTGDGKLN